MPASTIAALTSSPSAHGPKSSSPGTPDMPWCNARTVWPAIVISPMLKNLISGSGPPVTFSSTFIAVGPWTWKR